MSEACHVGVGILGAGRPNVATSNQIPACLHSRAVRLVALCDRLEGVHEVARAHGVRAYTDYAALLADPEIEMVQVATPDWCHVEHAEMALAAGKHVLLQKPPCVDREGLRRLRAAQSTSRARLKVLLNTRQTRLCRTVHALLGEGLIGGLVHVRLASRGHRFPIADLASPYLRAELGGVWIHNGLHWLDEACYYSGALPVAVQVVATRHDHGPAEILGEGPNYWCGSFDLGAGTTFTLEYNTMLLRAGLPAGMQRVLIGTEGELRQDYGQTDLTLFRRGKDAPEGRSVLDPHLTPAEDSIESFRRAIDAFAAEIRDGQEREPTTAGALQCMEALIAGAESAGNSRRLVL